MEVKLGVKGTILSKGRYDGWYILIEPVEEEFKGKLRKYYYLYLGENADLVGAYDTLIFDIDSVAVTLEAWDITEIEWLNADDFE